MRAASRRSSAAHVIQGRKPVAEFGRPQTRHPPAFLIDEDRRGETEHVPDFRAEISELRARSDVPVKEDAPQGRLSANTALSSWPRAGTGTAEDERALPQRSIEPSRGCTRPDAPPTPRRTGARHRYPQSRPRETPEIIAARIRRLDHPRLVLEIAVEARCQSVPRGARLVWLGIGAELHEAGPRGRASAAVKLGGRGRSTTSDARCRIGRGARAATSPPACPVTTSDPGPASEVSPSASATARSVAASPQAADVPATASKRPGRSVRRPRLSVKASGTGARYR